MSGTTEEDSKPFVTAGNGDPILDQLSEKAQEDLMLYMSIKSLHDHQIKPLTNTTVGSVTTDQLKTMEGVMGNLVPILVFCNVDTGLVVTPRINGFSAGLVIVGRLDDKKNLVPLSAEDKEVLQDVIDTF